MRGDRAESGAVGQELRRELRQDFRGELLLRDDPQYEEARGVWNGMFDRRPGLIARCRSVADVQMVVKAARGANVLTAVRCGGHSLAGFSSCDDGVVIDVSGMRDVEVDAERRRAKFGGGCLLGSVDTATQKAGQAFPSGVVSHTGAGGLVLGGGTGWLNRLHGLSCDNVEGFTLVTADGAVLRANARENEDLFWALRGGGGNFGVVTEFQVRLHPVSGVLFGKGFCVGDAIPRTLRRWREFMPEAPDELRWGFSLTIAPDREDVPAHVRRQPVASVSALWVGDSEDGRRHVQHALADCDVTTSTIRAMTFLELQTMADGDFPHGRRYYTKSGYFKSFEDTSIEELVSSLGSIPSPTNEIELAYLGGAAGRVGAHETSFGDRSSPFVMNAIGNWSSPEDDAANIAWIRGVFEKLRPAMTPGVYVNFMSGDEEDRVPEAYRAKWDRLVSIKEKYDRGNFFRLNQNIRAARP